MSIIMTSASSLEGYKITRQLGLVFGEVVYKIGFLKSMTAHIEDTVAVYSFGDRELGGTSRKLRDAREYAMNMMREEAMQRGANAIIAIDSESSMGVDAIHITMYGTAGYALPEDEYRDHLVKERREKAAKAKEEERQREVFARLASEGNAASILEQFKSCKNVRQLYDIWQGVRDEDKDESWYEPFDREIRSAWGYERVYGAYGNGVTNLLKKLGMKTEADQKPVSLKKD